MLWYHYRLETIIADTNKEAVVTIYYGLGYFVNNSLNYDKAYLNGVLIL